MSDCPSKGNSTCSIRLKNAEKHAKGWDQGGCMCEAAVAHWPQSTYVGGRFGSGSFFSTKFPFRINVVEDQDVSKPYQFEPLASAPIMPRVKSSRSRAFSKNGTLVKKATCKCTWECVAVEGPGATFQFIWGSEGKNAAQWCFYSCQKHSSKPFHQNWKILSRELAKKGLKALSRGHILI